MIFPVTLIDLAGFVALLLWGAHMVQSGVQRTFGPRLRAILGNALKGRLRAFLAGMGVTALLQSSTATGLMAAGFAAGGFVELAPALAVMLGANVGTTLIVQAFSFDVAAASPALIFVGVLMFRRGSGPRTHDLGRVYIGFGLMLLALHQLLGLMTPYEDAPSLRILLGSVSAAPLLAALLAAGLTWAIHSSVAVVLVIMSLASKGVVSPDAAFALVLGANLGAAINPVLEGPSGNDPAAKRLPVGNLITRAGGVAACLALLHPIGRLLISFEPDNARAVADFHTLFNLATAVAFLPLLTSYAALLRRLLPTRLDPADPSRPLYLDPAARETPIVALGAAAREALRLVDALEAMVQGARDALVEGDRKQIADARRLDSVLDRLNAAIKSYLAAIDPDELSEADHRKLHEILTFTTNIEQAGDVVDRNLLPHASKRLKRGLVFTKEGEEELAALMDRLVLNLRTAATVFMTEDPRGARLLAEEKAAFRDAEATATHAHFERMRAGRLDAIEVSALYLDLLRDIKLANSHIVAAAAYPVLERCGELLPSRIATNGR
ncbi:Na/Pi cotransporter family protein [Methylocapsa polymorpha]|uniref:Na/Pi cotransporter family protein n=1 Tax=Methylocapsa polymorpha TaxID=3080828 RepID=A0ABZ0HXX0_9HYPH|nr:Na/Pi cotransporter family protein [Methylocapsa sp. RX1]